MAGTALMEPTDTTKRIAELAAEEIHTKIGELVDGDRPLTAQAAKTIFAAIIYKHIREQREL